MKDAPSFLISPTAFKGTLSPFQAAHLIQQAIRKKFPHSKIFLAPLADGGDGTLEVLLKASKSRLIQSRVTGPLGQKVKARWAVTKNLGTLKGKTALIEMANASGLKLVRGKNKPLEASSVGTGQLIKKALEQGCKNILIGVGGTASSDGGAGALYTLGLRFVDAKGKNLEPHPSPLVHLKKVDWSRFDRRIAHTQVLVMCDVTNPLLGSHGSARTFSPQKGATRSQVLFLEKFLSRWSQFAPRNTQKKPGSGAAGALAFGLSGFAGAHLVPGTPFIMKTLRWEGAVRSTSYILTGEGKLDKTSFQGKVIGAISKRRGRSKILVVCGSTALSEKFLKSKGIIHVGQMGKKGMIDPKRSLKSATLKLLDKIKHEPN